jgi:hypothetical protein
MREIATPENIAGTMVLLTKYACHAKKQPEEICCVCSGDAENPIGFLAKDILIKHLGEPTTKKLFMIAENDTCASLDACVKLDDMIKAMFVYQELGKP